MQHLHKYTGFGLNIESELEFPELLVSTFEKPDLTISYRSISASLFPEGDLTKSFTSFQEKEFLLNFPKIARYKATDGNSILIDPYPDADIESVRLFLLSITMAAILTQRKKILLHTSAILQNEELILFIGESKAGKSSIAAELSKRGYTIFSDDVCVLEQNDAENNRILAYSSYPMLKLWDDTLIKLNDQQFDKSYKIRPALDKYGQFFHGNFVGSFHHFKPLGIIMLDMAVIMVGGLCQIFRQ